MDRFPRRTCVLGDALCSFDPLFGQGMTLACLQAELLKQVVSRVSEDWDAAAERFRNEVITLTETAWMLSTGEDFRHPEVQGKRPFGLGLMHFYVEKVHQLAAQDDEVYRRFIKVMNLLAGPAALFHPIVVAKVLWACVMPVKLVQLRPSR
jgi:2-polyprenyl-6-methoxyphenol hydroxylase-like FAD-dependent oxidoreductase